MKLLKILALCNSCQLSQVLHHWVGMTKHSNSLCKVSRAYHIKADSTRIPHLQSNNININLCKLIRLLDNLHQLLSKHNHHSTLLMSMLTNVITINTKVFCNHSLKWLKSQHPHNSTIKVNTALLNLLMNFNKIPCNKIRVNKLLHNKCINIIRVVNSNSRFRGLVV